MSAWRLRVSAPIRPVLSSFRRISPASWACARLSAWSRRAAASATLYCGHVALPRDQLTSKDTIGPITRCVADAAAVLTAIAQPDSGPEPLLDYREACRTKDVTGMRVGIPTAFISRSGSSLPSCQLSAFDAAARALVAVGVELVGRTDPKDFEDLIKLGKELAAGDPTIGREAVECAPISLRAR